MPNPAGSLLPRMRSLGRRRSKTTRQQSEAEAVPRPASTVALAELDGTPGAELSGSLPATVTSHGDVAVGSPTEDRRGSAGSGNHAAVLAQDLPRLQSLQQQYLVESDGRPHTAVSQQLDSVESRVAVIIGLYIERVQQSKHMPGGEERIKDVEELVYQFRTSQSNWIAQLQSSMEKAYRKLRPQASADSVALLFDDFDVLISQLDRNCHTPEDRTTVWILRDRYQTILDAKARLSALDYRWANVLAEAQSVLMRPSLRASRLSGPTVIIAPNGDTILELGFPPCFKFRVSSQVLSQASPFFDYALKPYRQDQIDARSPPPLNMEHDLGNTEFIRTSLTLPMTLRLRMDRYITVEALSTLLHAAHMRTDKVPRRVSFQDFVDIAFACYKYRCTAPIEIFVECFWLDQWYDRLGAEGYEDFFFISYVFGLERIFQKTSKAALMRMCDGPGSPQEDGKLPQEVWLRLRQIRTAKLKKVLQLSRRTLDSYLLTEDTSSNRARRSISISDAASLGNMDELQLKRQARCPHGSHECDAANLGWLMLVLNEVGLLPVVLDPLKEEEFFKYQTNSLKSVLCKLCAAPSAMGVHGGSCDYAPVFRNAVCDIYNGIKGLSIWDVNNDRLTGRRNSVMNYLGGGAADESGGIAQDVYGMPPEQTDDRRSVVGDRAVAGGSGSGNRLSQQSKTQSEGNTSVDTVSDGNTDLTEASRESRGSRLSRQNLQALDADTQSVVSTEVDIRTDRCTSPTLTTASVGTLLAQPDAAHIAGDELMEGLPLQLEGFGRDLRSLEGQKTSFLEKPSKYIMPAAEKHRVVLRSRLMGGQREEGNPEDRGDGQQSTEESSQARPIEAEPSQVKSAEAQSVTPDVPSQADQDNPPPSSRPEG